MGVDVAQGPPEQPGGARGGIDQPKKQLERCGLAGAVRPQQAEDLSFFKGQMQMVEHTMGALAPEATQVVLGQLGDFHYRHSTSSTLPLWLRSPRTGPRSFCLASAFEPDS